jgi:predicted dinucleotide-binding enzyme
MRLNNWSIAASYDTARIFAGLGFGSSTASRSIISRPRRTGVRAFNHLRAEVLANNPRADGGQRVLFYSGNDTAAKAEVAALIDRIGFVGIDLGSLAVGGKLTQFPADHCGTRIWSRSADCRLLAHNGL